MNKIITFLSAIALTFTIGCASLTDEQQVQSIASKAKIAAYVATAEFMLNKPETRESFDGAVVALKEIETAETVDFVAVLAIIRKLPTDKIGNEQTQIIVTAASMILVDFSASIPLDQVNDLRPIVRAIREGIEQGLK